MTADVKKVFQHAFTHGNFEMAEIVAIAAAEKGDGFDVKINEIGFEKDERSSEPLKTIWEGVPQFETMELRKLGLSRLVRSRLKRNY